MMNYKQLFNVFFFLQSILFLLCTTSCNAENENATTDNTDTDTWSAQCAANPLMPAELYEIATALKESTENVANTADVQIAMVPPYMTSFWLAPQRGAAQASVELNFELNFAGGEENENTAEAQQTRVDAILQEGVDALAISCKDASLMEQSISQAAESGIPVITFDSDGIAGSKRNLYLGTDNRSAGRTAGETMMSLIGANGGEVVLLLNSEDDSNLSQRKSGIEDAFDGSNVALVASYAHDGDIDVLSNNIRLAMADYPNLGGIISVNGHIGPVLADELAQSENGSNIKTVVFDLLLETQTYLDYGVLDAVIVQQSYFFGYLGGYILYAMSTAGVANTMNTLSPWLLNGNVLDTGTLVVTRDTLTSYTDYLNCLGINES